MSMTELMREALNRKESKPTLDEVGNESSLFGAVEYTIADIRIKAAAAIQQWVETEDYVIPADDETLPLNMLEDGETLADRLLALIVGIADANKDGEITDDEQGVLDVALNAAFDYLTQYGVDEEDAGALLNDWDAEAADRIRDLVAASLPSDPDVDGDIDAFAFSDNDAVFDAVYKKKMAIRGGKKVRINRRISGHVRLSARQKVAIRKAQMRSHNAGAMMRRMKSMRLRKNSGLK